MIEYILHTILFSELSYLFYGFLVIAFGGYFFVSGGSYLYFYVLKKSSWFPSKIQQPLPTASQIWHEIKWSLSSTIIWVFFSIGVIVGIDQGWFQVYFDIARYGLPYFIGSILLLIVLHDSYFYWTHRFMHATDSVFTLFHKTHHESTNPTPFAIHAFGPLEAMLYASFIPLVLLVFPVHLYALLVWIIIETIVNVLGHLGYELFPLKIFQTGIGKWINSPTHHNLHHQASRDGFGHYFNFWDRVMGTNLKHYDELLSRE